MLSEFLEELDKLQDRIATIYNEVDIVNRCTNLSPSSFIQNEGKMKGMQETLEEVINTRINIEDKMAEFLKNSSDGMAMAKIGLLEDEIRVLKDRLHIQDVELGRYKDILEKNSVGE